MKHAYLIIAHKETYVLETLIKMLDDIDHDIFIHIDAKNKGFDCERIKQISRFSKIIFINPIKVYWGDYSLVQCELLLLRAALDNGRYDYYHLLSGQDLPIKSNKYIKDFFERNAGSEFVAIANNGKPCSKEDPGGCFSFRSRLSLYHFGVKMWRTNKICKAMGYGLLMLQEKIGIDRISDDSEKIYYGSQWFSITDSCAKYILSQVERINTLFAKCTFCTDEMFMQTILMNSYYKNKVTKRNYRLIDFERGYPYVWKESDIDEIKKTDNLFARKFDSDVDEKVVDKVFQYVSGREHD